MIRPRLSIDLRVVVFLLMLSPSAWAQTPNSQGASQTPHAAASKAQGADVLWYGKAPPGWGGLVTDMKLLAPGIGWAERGGRFYWTTENGAKWTDITPPSNSDKDERISDFCFLDGHRGWALFSRFNKNESDEFEYEEPKLDLASTTDAGATWTRTHLTLPPPANYGNRDLMPLGGWGGRIAFLDPLHGWMDITLSVTHGPFFSLLLVTSDGGRTWSRAANTPVLAADKMLLVTVSDGWMIGTSPFSDKEVFVTHDGTKSWHQVLVASPKTVLPATMARYYQLPTFEDNKCGYLSVYYSGGIGVNPAAVLFATDDGGRTWKPDRMVTQKYDSPLNSLGAVIDSAWVWATMQDTGLKLTTVNKGQRIEISGGAGAVGELSFVSPTQVWVVVGGSLMSTTDGGTTWTTITPGPQPRVIQPAGN
jgi:photosystem II stability/assembly factor-like uncharacterized protein